MTAPLVSIIIPCFNAERFVAETLDSVQAQTYRNYEVIVIDDGSTDGSAAIIRAYENRFAGKLRWESTPNRGVSAARNLGTALAGGNYFQYLDADDLLRPYTLQERVAALEDSGDDIAYCDWQELVEDPSGQFTPAARHSRRIEDTHPLPDVAIMMDFWAPPAALLYRREVVARTGQWREDMPICQDGRFLFDAVSCGGRLRYVPGIGADYRVTTGSFSRGNPVAFMREWAEDAFDVEAFWRQHGELTQEQKKAVLQRLGKTTSVLYELDREYFWKVYRHMQLLQAGCVPNKTRTLSLAAKLLGYPRAEALALMVRTLGKRLSRE